MSMSWDTTHNWSIRTRPQNSLVLKCLDDSKDDDKDVKGSGSQEGRVHIGRDVWEETNVG